MQFESVTVEMSGGGQLVIDKLNAASLDLEVGAGGLQVSDELRAQECEIEVGAGEVSVAKLDAKVSDILNYHFLIKHIRGGVSTKLKYAKE